MVANCEVHYACVQWVNNANPWRVLLMLPWVTSISICQDPAERHPVLKRPAAAIIIKGERAEHERLLLGHLDVAHPPLADAHAAVSAYHWQTLHALRLRLHHTASRQVDKAELRSVAERIGGDGTPGHANPPQPAGEGYHIMAVDFVPPASDRERGWEGQQLLPLPCLRQEAPHEVAPLHPFVVLDELGDGVPVRWPVRTAGVGEEAETFEGRGLLGAVDVREAEQLAGDEVADEARGVGIHVKPCPPTIGAVARPSWKWKRMRPSPLVAETPPPRRGMMSPSGSGGPGVNEVVGDKDMGGDRGFPELEQRALPRGLVQDRVVDHGPRRALGGRGEPAAEVTGGGGGET
jgi:hypothetical protein